MRIITILSFVYFFLGSSFSQDMGFHFGHQMYGVFNAKQPLHGISIGIDIPRSGFITPYGQPTVFSPRTNMVENIGQGVPVDPNDFFNINVNGKVRASTYSLEFGTMYYIGGAYDYGFSGMVHNSLRLLLIPQKVDLIDFDINNYDFIPFQDIGGTGFVLNTSFGLGVKYTFEWGSLYALGGIELALFGDKLPRYYYDETGDLSPLSFSTRIGIRRELDFSKSGERKQIRENNRKERQKW